MQQHEDYFPKEVKKYLDKVTERKWLRRKHNLFKSHKWIDPFTYTEGDYSYLIVHCKCGNMNAKVVKRLPENWEQQFIKELVEETL